MRFFWHIRVGAVAGLHVTGRTLSVPVVPLAIDGVDTLPAGEDM